MCPRETAAGDFQGAPRRIAPGPNRIRSPVGPNPAPDAHLSRRQRRLCNPQRASDGRRRPPLQPLWIKLIERGLVNLFVGRVAGAANTEEAPGRGPTGCRRAETKVCTAKGGRQNPANPRSSVPRLRHALSFFMPANASVGTDVPPHSSRVAFFRLRAVLAGFHLG